MSTPYEIICDSVDREHWLERRREGVGGSDSPAILGLLSWQSPVGVQADKWNLDKSAGQRERDEEQLWFGREIEPVILKRLGLEIGRPVAPYGYLIRSTRWPWMQCTPDGEVDAGVLYAQAKNTTLAAAWQDGAPMPVWVQCQHEMAVLGTSSHIAVALVLGARLRWQRIERDEAFITEHLVPVTEEFWKATQAGEPWHIDGHDATRRALQKLYPDDQGTTIELDGSFTARDLRLLGLKVEAKRLEAEIATVENELRAAIGEHTWAQLPNGVRYSLRSQTRKEQVVQASTFRVLRRHEAKETHR